MKISRAPGLALLTLVATAASLSAQQQKKQGLPDGPGKDTVQRVCGSTCHGSELLISRGYTRDVWAAVTSGMISRGAKASDTELTEIVDYLAKNLPKRSAGAAGAGGSGFIGAGADDAHIVDEAAADRGRTVYIAECITCHGNKARGGDVAIPNSQRGSDLVRSLVVLKDRYGAGIGAFLKKGHPLQSGKSAASLSGTQLIDLAHFLHQKVTDTLRSGPNSKPINVLTGDAKAGAAYFNGAGGCTRCHNPNDDLKEVGKRYDPVSLQQKFLFPRSFVGGGGRGRRPAKPVTVTVTLPNGQKFSGSLVHLDDFNVSLRDAEGEYHGWKRTASMKIEKNDPFAEHNALLDRYTDKNIHDVVAYLETLK